jgi:hypothetical protein
MGSNEPVIAKVKPLNSPPVLRKQWRFRPFNYIFIRGRETEYTVYTRFPWKT